MNIGFWLCGVLVIPFVIIGVLFAIFKEKAAKFVSGFNSLPKEEQALYDKAHISRDIKNQCFTWTGIMLIGAVLSYFLTPYMVHLSTNFGHEFQKLFSYIVRLHKPYDTLDIAPRNAEQLAPTV